LTASERARVHLLVSGRVQGVFFRRAVADKARALDITGWARNLNDGSVEIVGEGERHNLELLVAWAHHGPPHARVDAVQVKWESFAGEFARFQVR
jgi:acylphosphatase